MAPEAAFPEAAAAVPAERRAAWLRAVLSLAPLVMLALSWPLWMGANDFPRVPFVAGLPEISWPWAAVLWVVVLIAVAASGLGIAWRAATAVAIAGLGVLVLLDQHRFQPWVYQYVMVGLALAGLGPGQGLKYARWWYVATYVHSGLSKLDAPFCGEMGPLFLAAALRPLGTDPASWPAELRTVAALAMPAGELVVAALLAGRPTRRLGLAGATVLHLALLGILGPWGLGHSTIVLVWNAAMLAEVWVAFGPAVAEEGGRDPIPGLGPVVRVLLWAAMIAPLGERWGWLDAWPAHALYASHGERTEVDLFEEAVDAYPPAVRRHLGPAGLGPWRRLDLTGWSRDVRGVPVYPQGRACLGLAEALAARYGGGPVRVVQWSRTDVWTGRRRREECIGLEAIRRQAGHYRLNANPGRIP